MKNLVLILMILLATQISGQDYKLLTSKSKKLYNTLAEPVSTYSLSIESAKLSGSDSVYYNFFGLATSEIVSDTCEFWGGPICIQQNTAIWSGPKIVFDNNHSYRFFNLNYDTLTFAFNTEVDGPIPIFSDSIQHFSMMYIGDDTTTLLNEPDSVRIFTISHLDNEGSTIESPLNGYNIVISKKFGLASFFVIDSFPEVLKPLKLIGNMSPDAGLYQITNEMVYDHQPGDAIQFSETKKYWDSPPWYSYTRYRKWSFLNRIETDDSLNYVVRETLFYKDSSGIEIDTIHLKYLKSKVIAEIPFDKFDWRHRMLFRKEYCDIQLWTYTTRANESTTYCEADTCWGHKDTGHPPENYFTMLTCGLGMYEDKTYVEGPYYYFHDKIIYFKKDGNHCGTEKVLGENKKYLLPDKIIVAPIPAQGEFKVSSPIEIAEIVINNSSGNIVFKKNFSEKQVKISTSNYPDGIYLLTIRLNNYRTFTRKVVVLHE